MKNVLWLASWYPNQLSPFDGDFLQRHAKAVALFCRVYVIYVVKDETKSITGNSKVDIRQTGNLTEHIIYYAVAKTGIKVIDKYISQRKYNRLYRRAVRNFMDSQGKPEIIHVQIAMKAGLLARWINRKWNIPYVLSEQWTAYLDNADLQISDYPFVFQKLLKRVLKGAAAVTVVSHHLGKAMQQLVPGMQYQVIPNVVDTAVFYPVPRKPSDKIRLIHISNMNYQKNTEAILEAISVLKDDVSFEMHLYGTINPVLNGLIDGLGLQAHVFPRGEVPQTVLAAAIQESDALVLYSRFETFGCVLIEANACGVPVIVSDIEVFHELIEEGVNGIFVEKDQPLILAEKIRAFMAEKAVFDNPAIAHAAATKYNYQHVGQQFIDVYDKTTGRVS